LILWTDWPRRRILDTLSTQLGMELKASSLSTGWTGTTKIENLVVKLPHEEKAFLTIPEIHLSHSCLPRMLLNQSVVLDSIQIYYPAVDLRQDQSGHWNAQDVVTLITEISRSNAKRLSDLTLPDLEIREGNITITDRNDKVTPIGSLRLDGKCKRPPAWWFELAVPDKIHLEGEIGVSAVHAHKIVIKVERGAEFLGTGITGETAPLNPPGQIDGQATISLNNWLLSSSQLSWQNIDLAILGDWWPILDGLTGRSAGILTAQPADQQRPLGPLYIQAQSDLSDAAINGAQLGSCEVVAYAGEDRLIIKQLMLEMAEGIIRARATFSRHDGELFTYMNCNFKHLDLDQLVHMFQPQANKVAGCLTGSGSVVFSRDLKRLTGNADFQLSETDLVNNFVIATLYNSLNLKFDQAQLTGVGRISLRAEGAILHIPSFYYFNRGVEVRGAGVIKDISLGLASPIEGYAIGSTRPLKGMRLPGVEELDKLMSFLQKSVASVKIEGTLAKPVAKVVPFPEVSSSIRRLLWGQLRE